MPSSSKAIWRKWYADNKEGYNARRKKKRDADPALRGKIAAKQKAYRESKPQSDPEAPRFKKVQGKLVQVFRIGDVAAACNRSVQAIRIWEREEKIPRPTVPGGHRYYTQHQLQLLVQFAETMDEVRYEPAVRAATIEAMKEKMAASWKQNPKT